MRFPPSFTTRDIQCQIIVQFLVNFDDLVKGDIHQIYPLETYLYTFIISNLWDDSLAINSILNNILGTLFQRRKWPS